MKTEMPPAEPRIVTIPPPAIDKWWSRVEPWARDFCQHSQGSYDPPYLLRRLKESLMQLWLVMKDEEIIAVCLTEVRKTLIRECVIVVMTGEDMASWVKLLALLEQYAISMGCKKMVGVARPGWERVIKPYGYRKTHVQLEKDL